MNSPAENKQGEETQAEGQPLTAESTAQQATALKQEGAADRELEDAAREDEAQEISQIRSKLGAVEKQEKPKENKSPTELYDEILKPNITGIINAWGLQKDIEKCQKIIKDAKEKKRVSAEKEAVHTLMKKMKKIPFDKWAFFPEKMAEKAANCSGMAMIFGHILKEDLKLNVMQTNPWRHTANIVTYSDGSTEYVDARNQVIKEIKLGEPIKEQEGFKIYQMNLRGFEYSLLPVADIDHAGALTYLENICEMQRRAGGDKNKAFDPEAAKAIEQYSVMLDAEFAESYMRDKFLRTRENDDVWKDEKNEVDNRRGRQSIPFIGKLLK